MRGKTQPQLFLVDSWKRTEKKTNSHLSNGLNGGSIFDQQFHYLHPVLLTSNVERSETILQQQPQQTNKTVKRLRFKYNVVLSFF